MKRVFLLSVFFVFVTSLGFSKDLVITGYFQGDNLYVLNPFAEDGESFCITDVFVNGEKAKTQIKSSSFELDLTLYGLEQGDSLSVLIKHKDGCDPKVVNTYVLNPISNFTITSINVDNQGILKWSTIEERGKLPYVVEQYRWNRWIPIGKVDGLGAPSANDYEFNLNNIDIKPHAGINKYRVKQNDFTGTTRYSLETSYRPGIDEVSMLSDKKVKEQIQFSAKTSFQLINMNGDVVKQGYDEVIQVSDLEDGKYFLNFDSQTEKIKKK